MSLTQLSPQGFICSSNVNLTILGKSEMTMRRVTFCVMNYIFDLIKIRNFTRSLFITKKSVSISMDAEKS